MSRIATRIRGYVNDPTVSDRYGAWGALRPDQRRQIRELCDTCDMFEKVADELFKQSGWISVDERLPDKYGDYICCTQKGTIWQLTYNPKYKLFNVSYDNVENAMDVTYWMPFPQAPKMKGGTK
jgi:hypothetical protein